jgi:hypothetical protein
MQIKREPTMLLLHHRLGNCHLAANEFLGSFKAAQANEPKMKVKIERNFQQTAHRRHINRLISNFLHKRDIPPYPKGRKKHQKKQR